MTDADLAWAMQRLALDMTLLARSTDTAVPFEDRLKAHADLQASAKRAFKRAALELHPDRTGGDTAKTEEFKRLATLAEMVALLPVPQPVRKKVVIGRYRASIRFTTPTVVL